MKILVTGGCGYIGSHTIVDLIENGFEVFSIDNLINSNINSLTGIEAITGQKVVNLPIDLCDYESTREALNGQKFDGVIHFAALKSVPESVENPILYYENNINCLTTILKIVSELNIPNFVFSSSCSVYGNTTDLPVTEASLLQTSESPYAATKQMGEHIIKDFSKKSNTNFILLRYFNPTGAHPSSLIGEVHADKPQNLIPAITQTAAGLLPTMHVWGTDYDTPDGSCVRDYVHVCDIAKAHTLALQYLIDGKQEEPFDVFNLGTGKGISVLEAINSFEKACNVKLNYTLGPRRDGDVISIYANNSKATELLGWNCKYTIDDMMTTAWAWQQKIMEQKLLNA
jgi:UDP-glucose 4-epimerase